MQALILLFAETPLLAWCAVGALFIATELASGQGRLIWPAMAAGATGVAAAAGLGGVSQLLVFFGLTGLAVGYLVVTARRRRAGKAAEGPPPIIIRARPPLEAAGSDPSWAAARADEPASEVPSDLFETTLEPLRRRAGGSGV